MLGTFVLNVQYICPQCSVQMSPILGTFFCLSFHTNYAKYAKINLTNVEKVIKVWKVQKVVLLYPSRSKWQCMKSKRGCALPKRLTLFTIYMRRLISYNVSRVRVAMQQRC